jgi:hypothetical protein
MARVVFSASRTPLNCRLLSHQAMTSEDQTLRPFDIVSGQRIHVNFSHASVAEAQHKCKVAKLVGAAARLGHNRLLLFAVHACGLKIADILAKNI